MSELKAFDVSNIYSEIMFRSSFHGSIVEIVGVYCIQGRHESQTA